MGDEPDFSFAAPDEAAPLLKNDSRDSDGDMIFAKLNVPIPFLVLGWNPFTGTDGKQKAALQLQTAGGSVFVWPLGATARSSLRNLGLSHPDELKDSTIYLEAYETGSEPPYDIGKRVVEVSRPKSK